MTVAAQPAADAARPEALSRALLEEAALLEELGAVLAGQRDAIAGHDLARLDDTGFAAHRILLTLAQARRRRTRLLELLGGPPGDARLEGFEHRLGAAFTAEIREGRDRLRRSAAALAEQVRRNGAILEGALAAGDQLIRCLCGAGAAPLSYHRAEPPRAPDGAGLLLDRQA